MLVKNCDVFYITSAFDDPVKGNPVEISP